MGLYKYYKYKIYRHFQLKCLKQKANNTPRDHVNEAYYKYKIYGHF